MSLKGKVSATLLAVMAAVAVLSYFVLGAVIAPAFDQLEIAAAETNLVRARRAIEAELGHVAAITQDWARWDDAYAFVQGRQPSFIKANLNAQTITDLDLNLMLFYDAAGRLHWGGLARDGRMEDLVELPALGEGRAERERLLAHDSPLSMTRGLLQTVLGPVLICSTPIVTTAQTGPATGTLLMGRFFDQAQLQRLRQRTEVDFTMRSAREPATGTGEVLAALRDGRTEPVHHAIGAAEVVSYGLIRDLFGEPLLILEARTPRDISTLGRHAIDGAALFLALGVVLVAVISWVLLQRSIVVPLAALARHIIGIRRSGDLSQRLGTARSDEIGALAGEFDKLTGELHDARRLLLEQSFKAGKADTAAEVLHNIRNAMTPLVNRIERVSRKFESAGQMRIEQALAELNDPACPAERRSKLLRYLEAACAHLRETDRDAIGDLKIASQQARHVEAILVDQERFANVAPVFETLDLHEVVDEAIHVIPKADSPGFRLSVEKAVDGCRIQAHRVGLSQVLGNLMLNAYEAIRRAETRDGSILVEAGSETVEGRPMVRLTIRDNGCGFDEQVRQRLFTRGFSSKNGRTSGLGLHWCANALAGMGGRIQAESVGLGRGASFHVLLPAAQRGPDHEHMPV